MRPASEELEAAIAPDSMNLTETRTGLHRRTNRPRVYIAGGLAGATGGGMFLDLAYSVRSRLKRMGYDAPEKEYTAWKQFFLTSSYRDRPAAETISADLGAVTEEPAPGATGTRP